MATSEKVSEFGQKTPLSLSIAAMVIPLDQKLNHLIHFIQEHHGDKMIVYGLTCACIDYWFYILKKVESLKSTIRALHGRMQQNGREKAMQLFAADASGVLLWMTCVERLF